MTKAFISYSWDDEGHKIWVRNLAAKLRRDGIDVTLDQWHLIPGDQIPQFMERSVRESDFVLIICTPKYKQRSDNRQGGVGSEGDIMTAEVMSTRNDRKFIPILRKQGWKESAPTWLSGKVYVDFSSSRNFKKNYNELLYTLSGKRKTAPPVGVEKLTQPNYKSLQEKLLTFGVNVSGELNKTGVLDKLEGKFIMDDVIVDAEFAGFRGVDESSLSFVNFDGKPKLPLYVYGVREKIGEPKPNKKKAFLANWFGPVIDRNNKAALQIGYLDASVPGGFYDYWTTRAVVESIPDLQKDLLNGVLQLRELARRMDLVVVVVTSDSKVVIARRSQNVDNARGNWMVSIGESLDPSIDLDINNVPNPFLATRRCLLEYDEINLAPSDVESAHLRALGIATEWKYLYANLIVLVYLEVEFGRVKERFSDGEHTHIEGVDFVPEKCLPLIKNGWYDSDNPNLSAPIVPASRVALLMSLMSHYGYDEIVNQIK